MLRSAFPLCLLALLFTLALLPACGEEAATKPATPPVIEGTTPIGMEQPAVELPKPAPIADFVRPCRWIYGTNSRPRRIHDAVIHREVSCEPFRSLFRLTRQTHGHVWREQKKDTDKDDFTIEIPIRTKRER